MVISNDEEIHQGNRGLTFTPGLILIDFFFDQFLPKIKTLKCFFKKWKVIFLGYPVVKLH